MARTALVALLLVLLAAAPAVAAGEGKLGEITGDKVRLRAGPGTVHAVLGEFARGDLVIVTGEENGWKQVKVPGGIVCYVHDSLVEIQADGTAKVTGSRVLLRPAAGKDLLPLGTTLDRGDSLGVLDRDGDWLKVLAPERVTAFVYGEYVRELGPAEEFRERIARAARDRREKLLAGPDAAREKASAERQAKAEREAVVGIGKAILDDRGDAADLERRLKKIALDTKDELTRGYAQSLLALLGLRADAEKLRAEVDAAKTEKAEILDGLKKDLADAKARYAEALRKAREMRAMRESPYGGVGRIEKREDGYVLVEKDRVLFRLVSKKFDLQKYVGRRVGVRGHMTAREQEEKTDHLMVDRIEVLEPLDKR